MFTLETTKFTYDPSERSFVAEASEIPEFDLIGEGSFYLRSQWTGKTACARFFHVCRDRERDILYWDYSVPDAGVTVRIFND